MSRPIKFRAWLPEAQHMWMPKYIRNAAETQLMQFTGLRDKNGTEIYEGDILDDLGVIQFRDDLNWDSGGSIHSGFFSTKGYEYRADGCLSYHYQIAEHEVIGNIYENPELLPADGSPEAGDA